MTTVRDSPSTDVPEPAEQAPQQQERVPLQEQPWAPQVKDELQKEAPLQEKPRAPQKKDEPQEEPPRAVPVRGYRPWAAARPLERSGSAAPAPGS